MESRDLGEKRFAYFYFNRLEPERTREVAPAHVEYWHTVAADGYIGGPLTDPSGGLISFLASDLEQATELAQQDPFVLEGLVAEKWIKE